MGLLRFPLALALAAALASPVAAAQRVQLREVAVDGAPVEWEAYADLIEPLLGQPLSVADLEALRDNLEKELLRHKVLGVLRLPEQEVTDGVLQLVFEPKVLGEVVVDASIPHRLDDDWARQFVLVNLKPGDPIHLDRLESSILKLNDLAGVKAKSQLIPVPGSNRMNVLLKISDTKLLNGKVDPNNLINGLFGDAQLGAKGKANDLLGRGERIDLELQGAGFKPDLTQRATKAKFQLPLAPNGASATVKLNWNDYSVVGQPGVPNDAIAGNTRQLKLDLQLPLERQLAYTTVAQFNFEAARYINNFFEQPLTDRSKTVGRGNVFKQWHNDFAGKAINNLLGTMSMGQMVLDNDAVQDSQDSFGPGVDGFFAKANLSLNRVQMLSRFTELTLNINAQKALVNNLDLTESMNMGFPGGVRAYPPGQNMSNDGVVGQLDLAYYFTPEFKLFGLVDGAWGRLYNQEWAGQPYKNSFSLFGTGAGMRWKFRPDTSLQALLTHPIGPELDNPYGVDAADQTPGWQLWAGLEWCF